MIDERLTGTVESFDARGRGRVRRDDALGYAYVRPRDLDRADLRIGNRLSFHLQDRRAVNLRREFRRGE